MRRFGALVVGVLLVVGFTAACSSDSGSSGSSSSTSAAPAQGPNGELTISANEFSYNAPATISGGLVDLTLQNMGQQHHEAIAVKLDAGKTVSDYTKFFATPSPTGAPPGVVVAGVSGVQGGFTAKAAFTLTPGNYVWACFLVGKNGVPHVASGMAVPFTVAGDNGKAAPATTATATGTDFAYAGVPTLKVGVNTLTFKNNGNQDHEMRLVELQPGQTAQNVLALAAGELPGPDVPFERGGGGVAKGSSVVLTANIAPGKNYVFACFVPVEGTNNTQRAIQKGMVVDVKVGT